MPSSITGKQMLELLRQNKNESLKKEENNFNPNLITGKEIEEDFEISKSDMMSNIYYRIIERCELAHHGIMQKRENSAMFDFFELIKNNIDIRTCYKQKYKL